MIDLSGIRGLDDRLLVDTSESGPVYMLEGRNGRYMRLSPSAYHLLRLGTSGLGAGQVAAHLTARLGREISAGEIETLYATLDQRIRKLESDSRAEGQGFWFRIPLVPQSWVRYLASGLELAFSPAVAICALIGAGVAAVLAYAEGMTVAFQAASFWPGYALLLVSIFAHELGHAAACVRFGAQPSTIGFTVYLLYPAFYSDVSAAWELKRWQRVMVDLGGTYFQLLVGAAYALVYAWTGWEPLRVALLLLAGSCVFSLNPIFRFDGYWLVADALGVTNLGSQPARIIRHFAVRSRGGATPPLPWPAATTVILTAYSFASIAVWGWFLHGALPMLASKVAGYPALLEAVARHAFATSSAMDTGALHELAFSTMIVAVAVCLAGRLARGLLRGLARMAKRMRGSVAATSATEARR
ncbi:MAG: hypothetical protein HYV63_12770 [Candidatus Schekmanbacteria bacterium]|nr:hypothetical protein [Candidatus Schekmanbacteria bacterium]